jgi:hypothetical protein
MALCIPSTGQMAVDEIGSGVGEIQENGHSLTDAVEYLATCGPSQHHQTEDELQDEAPDHLTPLHLSAESLDGFRSNE